MSSNGSISSPKPVSDNLSRLALVLVFTVIFFTILTQRMIIRNESSTLELLTPTSWVVDGITTTPVHSSPASDHLPSSRKSRVIKMEKNGGKEESIEQGEEVEEGEDVLEPSKDSSNGHEIASLLDLLHNITVSVGKNNRKKRNNNDNNLHLDERGATATARRDPSGKGGITIAKNVVGNVDVGGAKSDSGIEEAKDSAESFEFGKDRKDGRKKKRKKKQKSKELLEEEVKNLYLSSPIIKPPPSNSDPSPPSTTPRAAPAAAAAHRRPADRDRGGKKDLDLLATSLPEVHRYHPAVSPRNGTDISIEQQMAVLRCPNQSKCIVPDLQLKLKVKVYFCRHPARHGVRFYFLAREGLLLHPGVELVPLDQIESADFIVYLPGSSPWHLTECNNASYAKRMLVLDEFDGYTIFHPFETEKEVIQVYGKEMIWYFMYFKRSFVARKDGKFLAHPHLSKPDVYPMTYAIAEAYVQDNFNFKREIEILCTLRGSAKMTTRQRVQEWIQSYANERGVKNVITGEVGASRASNNRKKLFDC